MKNPRRIELRLLLLLALLPSGAHAAQVRRPPQTKAKQTAKAERDAKERERRERQQAAAAVGEAVASSPEVKDPYKRSLLLALAADALWSVDEQAARALFARAWEAAVASDEEEMAAEEEHLRKWATEQNPPGKLEDHPEDLSRSTRARREVLSTASRHDTRLTERYLAELRESIDARVKRFGQEATPDDSRRYNARDYSVPGMDDEHVRLDLSRSLAEEGAYGQAAELAAQEVAGGVSAALVRYLIEFRRAAPAEADALYRRLLARAAADPRAGTNDALLLSSYALTPSLLAAVDWRGWVSFSPVGGAPNAQTRVPRALRQQFYETAAGLMLRAGTRRTAGSDEAREAHARGLFFALERLLPYFEEEAPQLTPQLNALHESVAAELSELSRELLAESAEQESLAPRNPIDPLENDLEYAKTGPLATARDAARQQALFKAVKLKLWARAREAIAGMEDAELRAYSVELLAVCQVAAVGEAFGDDEDGDERAAQFVESATVPPLTRALGYAHAALLASKQKRQARTRELLERARTFAEQTDAGKEARFVALLVVANAAEQADPASAWAMLPALVRAANECGDAPADELGGGFRTPKLEGAENVGVAEQLADFRLDELFAGLARRDLPRALREARALTDATTRSLVTVAAARARLAPKGSAEVLRRGAK